MRHHRLGKYILAILAFVIALFILPFIIYLILSLTNLITPKYFRSSEVLITIVATVLGVMLAVQLVDRIVPKSPKFTLSLCILCAVYTISVGIYNFYQGVTEWYNMVSMIAGGIAALKCGIAIFRE